MKPILLHIPHSSLKIPDNVRPTFSVDKKELERELLLLTDRYTDELFQLESAERLVFGVSRLVVDPERFEDDAKEPMANRGMGAVYTQTTSGALLRSDAGREHLISEYYRPHHELLNNWAQEALDEHGRCLLIDCHSYPSQPLPCDQDQTPERPMFCVGTDPLHTPPHLTKSLVEALEELAEDFATAPLAAFSGVVLVDRPYSGTMVPSRFYGLDPRVESIMIEVNRKLYMDEETGEKLPRFEQLCASLEEVLDRFAMSWIMDFEEETWMRVPAPVVQRIVLDSCKAITPEAVFKAIEKLDSYLSCSPENFLVEVLGRPWIGEMLEVRENQDDFEDGLSELVMEILERVAIWSESGVHIAGLHEFDAHVYWLDVEGVGLATVAVEGGDELCVLDVRPGIFDESQRKSWLDQSVAEFVESQEDFDE